MLLVVYIRVEQNGVVHSYQQRPVQRVMDQDCKRQIMKLTDLEKIHKGNLNILLLNSCIMTTDMQHAIVFALECIEDMEEDSKDVVWMTPEEEEKRIRKSERESVLKELSILIHEWEVVAEGTKHWSSYNRMYRKIESLRGEP